MPTNFPTSLDDFTNPTSNQSLAQAGHASLHSNLNDAIEAVEAKVGVDASTVTTSIDYLLRHFKSESKPTAYSVLATDGGKLFDNAGASARVDFTLPSSPQVGMRLAFAVADTDGLRVIAPASHTIRFGHTLSQAAGYIESYGVGSTCMLTYRGSNAWEVTGLPVGTWDVQRATIERVSAPHRWVLRGTQQFNAGSTSEQEFTNLKPTILANSMKDGWTLFDIYACFVLNYNFGESPTMTIRLRLGGTGGTALLSTGAIAEGGAGSRVITIRGVLNIATLGASGTVWAEGNGVQKATAIELFNSGTLTWDTTADKTLSLSGQFGSGGTSSTTLRLVSAYFERTG